MQRIKNLPYFASKKTQIIFLAAYFIFITLDALVFVDIPSRNFSLSKNYEIVLCDFDNILFALTWMNVGNLFLKYNKLKLFPGIWWNPEGIVHSIVSHQKAPDQEILFSLRSDFQLQPQPDLHPEHPSTSPLQPTGLILHPIGMRKIMWNGTKFT